MHIQRVQQPSFQLTSKNVKTLICTDFDSLGVCFNCCLPQLLRKKYLLILQRSGSHGHDICEDSDKTGKVTQCDRGLRQLEICLSQY